MNRSLAILKVVATVLLGMITLLAVCVGGLAWLVPEFSEGLTHAWQDYTAQNLDANSSIYGVQPLLDIALLIGSYIFVSLALWSGRILTSKIANRSHFSK